MIIAHEHRLRRLPDGRIACTSWGCVLDVDRPAGVPDYRRAVMRRW